MNANASRWQRFVQAWRRQFYRNTLIYCAVLSTTLLGLQIFGPVYCGF